MKKGFTIIEILVVIGIIAVLTTISFPAINSIRAKNRDTEKIADIANIQQALALYKNQNPANVYPNTLPELKTANYITDDALVSPNGDQYIYVPLMRGNGPKCTYYQLGVKLESGAAQIDKSDTFSTARGLDGKISVNSNGYNYCGGYNEGGIDTSISGMYQVHP